MQYDAQISYVHKIKIILEEKSLILIEVINYSLILDSQQVSFSILKKYLQYIQTHRPEYE